MDAKTFLRKNNLDGLIKVLVEDNKNMAADLCLLLPGLFSTTDESYEGKLKIHEFETVSDLQLLAVNRSYLQSMKIPVCWQIKFEVAINKVDHTHVIKPSPSTVKTNRNEISKKRLLQLAKTDLSAREVNSKYNDLNKVLLAELRRHAKKLKGTGALKRCQSTDVEDAANNMKIANNIVDSPLVTKFYDSFTIGNHGTFVINRAKAKKLLGRKLSVQRKPKRIEQVSSEAVSMEEADHLKDICTIHEIKQEFYEWSEDELIDENNNTLTEDTQCNCHRVN